MNNGAKTFLTKPTENSEFNIHPTQLTKDEREEHVKDALKYYNRDLIEENPRGANAKFRKLACGDEEGDKEDKPCDHRNSSAFIFFRGTADLMYRDLDGTDAHMTKVLCMGDVHLENFGVMEAEDGKLIWGLNDFDEAAFAPFSWDVKRGATSVVLAAAEGGISPKQRRKLAISFATSYLDTIRECSNSDVEDNPRFTSKKGPKMIRKLIKKAEAEDPEEWLSERIDLEKDRFLETDEIKPWDWRPKDDKDMFQDESDVTYKKMIAAFQKAIDNYVPSLADQKNPPIRIKVLDVATKIGSGTGSVGLWRYYVLVEAERSENTEKLILEVKQTRPSVLDPYVGSGPLTFPSHGSRIAFAENIHLPNANPYYGSCSLRRKMIKGDWVNFLVRERSPHKSRVKLKKLTNFESFKQYTKACGTALAYAHSRSDIALGSDTRVTEQRILQSVNQDVFADDIGHFAVQMAEQVTRDWKSFLAAYRAGSFRYPKQRH